VNLGYLDRAARSADHFARIDREAAWLALWSAIGFLEAVRATASTAAVVAAREAYFFGFDVGAATGSGAAWSTVAASQRDQALLLIRAAGL
jgi:hypothetical protein